MLPPASSTLPNLGLHSSKSLAVSLSALLRNCALRRFLAETSPGDFAISRKIVSVRISWVTPDGRYPLPLDFDNSYVAINNPECSDFPPPTF